MHAYAAYTACLLVRMLCCCCNYTYTYVHITQALDYTEPAVQNPGPQFASTVPQGTQAGTYINMHARSTAVLSRHSKQY
jgi:hypothetical protein